MTSIETQNSNMKFFNYQMVKLMNMKLYGAFTVKEILHDGDTAKLQDIEKDVIGKISLNICISGSAIKFDDL
jgi:hypothetical protein